MILTGLDVKHYIAVNKLKIEPIVSEQFQQNGVDLVLNSIERQYAQFYLGATREMLELPNDLMAFVQLRSTWARRGLMLPPTVVDAGFKGNLTLEIQMCGLVPPHDAVGERFAHLIFARLTGPAEPYAGSYQGQSGITPAPPRQNEVK